MILFFLFFYKREKVHSLTSRSSSLNSPKVSFPGFSKVKKLDGSGIACICEDTNCHYKYDNEDCSLTINTNDISTLYNDYYYLLIEKKGSYTIDISQIQSTLYVIPLAEGISITVL